MLFIEATNPVVYNGCVCVMDPFLVIVLCDILLLLSKRRLRHIYSRSRGLFFEVWQADTLSTVVFSKCQICFKRVIAMSSSSFIVDSLLLSFCCHQSVVLLSVMTVSQSSLLQKGMFLLATTWTAMRAAAYMVYVALPNWTVQSPIYASLSPSPSTPPHSLASFSCDIHDIKTQV